MTSTFRDAPDKTVITSHVNPDFDAIARMAGAAKLYPGAYVLFPGGQGKRLSSPFVKGVVSGLRVLRPRDLDPGTVKRLVVVDTRQRTRIGAAVPILLNEGLDVHLYDHHPDSEDDMRGSLSVTDSVGATVTILSEIIRERKIPLSPDEATMLALGLYEDTGSFTFGGTTPRDMLAGAYFLEMGADLETVASLTSSELSAEHLSLLNEFLTSAEVREARGKTIAVAMARRESQVED